MIDRGVSSIEESVKEMNLMSCLIRKYQKELTSPTRKLILICLINIIFLNIALIGLSFILEGNNSTHQFNFLKSTVIPHTIKFVLFNQIGDSWDPMLTAVQNIKFHPEQLLYTHVFFEERTKFQYPLTSLLPLVLLQQVLSSRSAQMRFLNLFSWLSVLVMIFFTVKIFILSYGNNFKESNQYFSKLNSTIQIILLVLLGINFYSVVKAYTLGQVQTILNCLFTVATWAWMTNKEKLAGLLIGTMILIKPQYLLLAVWGALRRKWSFCITCIVCVLSGLLVSIAFFGLDNHLDYLKVLSFISKHGEAYYPNQSINGLLNRVLFNGNNLEWKSDSFAPFHPVVYIGTLITSIILVIVSLLYPMKLKSKSIILDFLIMAVTCTVASPVAWEHHYGILLPIYAYLFPFLHKQPIFGKLTLPYFGLSYLLSSNNLRITNYFASTPLLNVIQSYLLFSVLMLLICLYVLLSKQNTKNLIAG